jgi:hypothetical protein
MPAAREALAAALAEKLHIALTEIMVARAALTALGAAMDRVRLLVAVKDPVKDLWPQLLSRLGLVILIRFCFPQPPLYTEQAVAAAALIVVAAAVGLKLIMEALRVVELVPALDTAAAADLQALAARGLFILSGDMLWGKFSFKDLVPGSLKVP